MTNEKDPSADTPIDPQDFLCGVRVIDFGDVRVSRGLSRRHHASCRHPALVYDRNERRVWCKDCERNVESFDAFCSLVENFHQAWAKYETIKAEALEARAHNLHLIAAKNIEKAWRGKTMALACPHCGGGLLPEDFTHGVAVCSAEIERRRREKK